MIPNENNVIQCTHNKDDGLEAEIYVFLVTSLTANIQHKHKHFTTSSFPFILNKEQSWKMRNSESYVIYIYIHTREKR